MVKRKVKNKAEIITECDKCAIPLTKKESKLWVHKGEVFVMHMNCLPRSVKIERGYIEVKQ